MTTCVEKFEALCAKLEASMHETHRALFPSLPGRDCPATRLLWLYWLAMSEVPRVPHKMAPIQVSVDFFFFFFFFFFEGSVSHRGFFF
jgi:hypothetical protein